MQPHSSDNNKNKIINFSIVWPNKKQDCRFQLASPFVLADQIEVFLSVQSHKGTQQSQFDRNISRLLALGYNRKEPEKLSHYSQRVRGTDSQRDSFWIPDDKALSDGIALASAKWRKQ